MMAFASWHQQKDSRSLGTCQCGPISVDMVVPHLGVVCRMGKDRSSLFLAPSLLLYPLGQSLPWRSLLPSASGLHELAPAVVTQQVRPAALRCGAASDLEVACDAKTQGVQLIVPVVCPQPRGKVCHSQAVIGQSRARLDEFISHRGYWENQTKLKGYIW